jgi:citrate synthase
MGDEKVHTRIWLEEAEPDNPFATRTAHCHGYDVFGDMLGRARWTEMLFLLFRGEAPDPKQTELLETLAVALANPGPRDPAVHAAMCGGVGGSPAASCLMAALAVGAGQYTGAREVFIAMQGWEACGTDLDAWRSWFTEIQQPQRTSVWPIPGHAPGFDPHGRSSATVVTQALACLATKSPKRFLPWLEHERNALEETAGAALSMTGVAAAALADLGFSPDQGEMLHLLLRLPGAAAHALEQRGYGYKKFPFYAVELTDDPAAAPPPTEQQP